MSLNLTVTIPLETASILRKAHDSRTADQDVDSALFTVANAVIDAVKALPWSITTSPDLQAVRTFSPYGVLTPPSSTYSKDSSGYCSSRPLPDPYSDSEASSRYYGSGRPLPDFNSASESSSRNTSGSLPTESSATSSGSEGYWSAKEEYVDEFSVDIIDVVDGEEQIYYLSVDGNLPLNDLAFRIEQVSGVPAEEQSLVWRGYRLNQPDAALSTYGVGDGSKIRLLRRAPSVSTLPATPIEEDEEETSFQPHPGYEIIVQTVGGKRIPTIVQGETTTSELASFIFDQQGICPGLQRLVHRGNIIFDGYAYDMGETHLIYTLGELGIGPDTIISLYFCNTMR